jgi:hypothetical protein
LPSRGKILLQLLLVVLVTAAVVVYVQAPAAGLYGYDGPFHIKFSQWMRLHGISSQFPWWQETFLKDRYADKDFLYHVLLIPFTYGDLSSGGKAASITFAVAMYASLFLSLAWLKVRAPAAWTLAIVASSTTLLYRGGLLRSHVIAISLALVGTAAILRSHRTGIALLSAAYALTHIAWHLLPGIALIHDGVASAMKRRPRFTATAWSLAGTAAAVLVNPYFPDNLRLWYVQNVRVLAMSWSSDVPDLHLGLEILPGRPWHLIYYNLGPVLLTIAGATLLWARRPGGHEAEGEGAHSIAGATTLGLLCLGFLGLSFLSRRFVEFWAPLSALFAAVAFSRGRFPVPRPVLAGLVVAFAALGAMNIAETRRIIGEDPGPVFGPCASWIRDNVPGGETVFTTDWDEFPELFFTAPEQRYLVGLDPTFMYVTDPDRWRLWRRVAEGNAADIYTPIRETFGCRFVFADAGHEKFIERCDQDPLLHLEMGSPDCSVYALRQTHGSQAPPSESGTLPSLSQWHLWDAGPASEAGPRGFIDVEQLRSAAPPHRREPNGSPGQEECDRLDAVLESETACDLVLGLSTDDQMRVLVNDETVFDSTVASPPVLEEILERESAGALKLERTFKARARAGYNAVSVSTCRVGRFWGFQLRSLESH